MDTKTAGRKGANKRWEAHRTRKMKLIQEMYKYHSKKAVDLIVKNRKEDELEIILADLRLKHDE